MAKSRLIGEYPVIGIRPTIDGRRGALKVRESLEDQTMNMDVAADVAEKYCRFVKQNPNDPTAPTWLFHAMEINVRLKDTDKCETLCNQLVDKYPESKWSPRALMLLGSYVYNDYLEDTAQAHVAFQRIIDEYPDSELVDDAQKSIEYLGRTPEEIMAKIMMSQMDEEEGEW